MSEFKITKKSKINGVLEIDFIDYETAKEMTIKNHYSHKWNTSFGKINVGIFKDGRLLGCAVFGNMMNPKAYKSIADIEQNEIVELNRMWIDDELGMNSETILISSSFKLIKRKYPHIKLVQSFADGRLGCGTIYKASNFNYYGYSKSLFFEDIETGEVFHKVPLENTKRPKGFLEKNKRYLDGKLKSFYVKTYKYIYILDKKTKVKLKQQPYPEYDKGLELVDYNHPLGVLCRLQIMYNLIEEDVDSYINILDEEMQGFYTDDEINEEYEKQLKNKSIIWFRDEYNKPKSNKELQTNIFDFGV